eukprot:gene10214-7158_t
MRCPLVLRRALPRHVEIRIHGHRGVATRISWTSPLTALRPQRQRQDQGQGRRPLPFIEPEEEEERCPDVVLRHDAAVPSPAPTDDDDDVVLDTPAALTAIRESGLGEVCRGLVDPRLATQRAGEDVVQLVTDAFQQQRERAVEERRRVLYEMTHPKPADYTYDGKLVPPPPFSFGSVAPESIRLANEMLVRPAYSLVFQAGTRASSNRIPTPVKGNDTAPSSRVETEVHRSSPRYRRGSAKEGNVFADHSYFFEINHLYQEVALVGRASAGKSTLLNAVLGQPGMARTSSTPHTTRTINFYQSVTKEEMRDFCRRERHNLVSLPSGGLQLTMVDIPGFGLEGMSERWRDATIELTDSYFGVRRSVNTVLLCIDCVLGLTKTDIKYVEWLENVQGVVFVVLTKCDAVPHSRICSVMRQVYSLITAHRRKFRKVFPFILPTSAVTGSNIDVLRGLLMETSGMIPGDRLRALLVARRDAWMKSALEKEAQRLGMAAPPVPQVAPADTPKLGNSKPLPRQTRDEFLRWRAAHPHLTYTPPFGGRAVRLNTGLEAPRLDGWEQLLHSDPAEVGGGPPPPDDGGETQEAAAAVTSRADHCRVLGYHSTADVSAPRGAVSEFVEQLGRFQQQPHSKRGCGRGQQAASSDGPWRRPAFMAEDAEGRLAPYTAGKRSGASLVRPESDVTTRKSEWKGHQLAALLRRENPEAPWRAVDALRSKLEESRTRASVERMGDKATDAYLRNAGRITDAFDKFEGEVQTAKFMTESRRAPTLRSREEMHLNATARINYRSMPPGLWKAYGSADPARQPAPRPQGSVLGCAADETHSRTTVSAVERGPTANLTREHPLSGTSHGVAAPHPCEDTQGGAVLVQRTVPLHDAFKASTSDEIDRACAPVLSLHDLLQHDYIHYIHYVLQLSRLPPVSYHQRLPIFKSITKPHSTSSRLAEMEVYRRITERVRGAMWAHHRRLMPERQFHRILAYVYNNKYEYQIRLDEMTVVGREYGGRVEVVATPSGYLKEVRLHPAVEDLPARHQELLILSAYAKAQHEGQAIMAQAELQVYKQFLRDLKPIVTGIRDNPEFYTVAPGTTETIGGTLAGTGDGARHRTIPAAKALQPQDQARARRRAELRWLQSDSGRRWARTLRGKAFLSQQSPVDRPRGAPGAKRSALPLDLPVPYTPMDETALLRRNWMAYLDNKHVAESLWTRTRTADREKELRRRQAAGEARSLSHQRITFAFCSLAAGHAFAASAAFTYDAPTSLLSPALTSSVS